MHLVTHTGLHRGWAWAVKARTVHGMQRGAGHARTLGGARDDDGAVGVVYDEVADAAEDRASYLAEAARPHHDVARLLARRHVDYELARLLEVRHELAPQLATKRTRHITTTSSEIIT